MGKSAAKGIKGGHQRGRKILMSQMMDLGSVLAVLNIVLLLGLLFIYGRAYGSIRSYFTLGLLLFASLFLFQNVIAAYSYLAMAPLVQGAASTYILAITAVQALGLSVLLFVTWRSH